MVSDVLDTAASGHLAPADPQHPRCPVWTGNFSAGGEREPLESYRIYDEVNRAGGSVWIDEGVGYHLITNRQDVTSVFFQPTVFSSQVNEARKGGIGSPYPMKPLQIDPPDHIKWRRVISPPFAPSAIRVWEDRVRKRANDLIDAFIDKGSCDFVVEFAHVFPTTIFLDFMGLPHSDLPQFMRWELAIIHPAADLDMTRVEAQAAVQDYFAKLIARRRKEDVAEGAYDLLSMAMSWELEGKPISDENLLSFCLLMFAAGLDTVTAELSYGMMHFATHPRDRQRIMSDPAIIDDAVEELLRVYPIATPSRVALEDTELNGCPIKRGDYVVAGLAGVGRNESDHENATEVDFDRERLPNTTFGLGIHRCVGAHLARLELKVAYEEWHRRIPDYRIPADARFTESANLVLGLNSLPFAWDLPAKA